MRFGLVVVSSMVLLGCGETPEPMQIDSPAEKGTAEQQANLEPPMQPEMKPDPKPNREPRKVTDPETPSAAIDRAISLLEAGKFRVYLEQFLSRDQQVRADDILSAFNTKPAAVKRLIATLRSVEGLTPVELQSHRVVFAVPPGSRGENEPGKIVLNRIGTRWGEIEFEDQ